MRIHQKNTRVQSYLIIQQHFFHIQMRYNNHTVDHSISQFCICRYSHEWWLEKGWLCWAHLEPSRRSQTSCLSSPIRIDPQFQCHFHQSKVSNQYNYLKLNGCFHLFLNQLSMKDNAKQMHTFIFNNQHHLLRF